MYFCHHFRNLDMTCSGFGERICNQYFNRNTNDSLNISWPSKAKKDKNKIFKIKMLCKKVYAWLYQTLPNKQLVLDESKKGVSKYHLQGVKSYHVLHFPSSNLSATVTQKVKKIKMLGSLKSYRWNLMQIKTVRSKICCHLTTTIRPNYYTYAGYILRSQYLKYMHCARILVLSGGNFKILRYKNYKIQQVI